MGVFSQIGRNSNRYEIDDLSIEVGQFKDKQREEVGMVQERRPEPSIGPRTGTWRTISVVFLLLLFPFLAGACRGSDGPGATQNALDAVVALAANNVWAVGGMTTPKHFGLRVLIEHWDGRSWHAMTPNIDGELDAISADATNDIWAVGGGGNFSLKNHLLVLHWNGQRWQQLPTGVGSDTSFFSSVLALSAHNVWAVGINGGAEAIIEHWDGSSWKSVTQPFEGRGSFLQAIAGREPNDLWAVGNATPEEGGSESLSEHWDGKSWKIVPMPGYSQDKRLLGNPDFYGLTAFSGTQMWAAGEIELSSVYSSTPMIERWNGQQWQVVYGSAPQNTNQHAPDALFRSIIALDAQNAWAVGDTGTSDPRSQGYVLVYHWDGQSWKQIKAPSLLFGSEFSSISAIAADDMWAVGSSETHLAYGDSVTLIEHWDGRSWRAVPSINPGKPGPPVGQA